MGGRGGERRETIFVGFFAVSPLKMHSDLKICRFVVLSGAYNIHLHVRELMAFCRIAFSSWKCPYALLCCRLMPVYHFGYHS